MVESSHLTIDDEKTLLEVCGINDKNLRRIEQVLEADIFCNGNEIHVTSDNKSLVFKVLENLIAISRTNGRIYGNLIDIICKELLVDSSIDIQSFLHNAIEIPKIKKVVNPRSLNQGIFIEMLKNNDIVFATGPAGTGKTFLAIAYAIQELMAKNYRKIILTRPVVEAGENLGFLPGDYIQKINPYLVPLYDAIKTLIPQDVLVKVQSQELIEIAPLAYMRGRTFSDAIVILDEAQNSTTNQMKLFLTRLGEKGKLIITGDITQIDLPHKSKSGMIQAVSLLKNINGIGYIEFNTHDVVRHPLVKKIINAYTKHENSTQN